MSFNAFMLPALPQLPASGSNSPGRSGSAAFKSDQNSSFAATLKQISARHHGNPPEAIPEAKSLAAANAAQLPEPQTMGQPNTAAPDAREKTASSRHLLQAFAGRIYHLMNIMPAGESTLAEQPLSDPNDGTALFLLADWIGHLQLQGQQVQGEPVGIGPFEQMQFNISPEAIPRFYLEQLALRMADPQNGEGQAGALAGAGNPTGQIESSGGNGNPLLNLLLHLSAMATPDTAIGFNTQTGSSGGPNSAFGPETLPFNAELLKMTASSQTAEAGISEGARMAAADRGSPQSFWASGDVSSDTPAEAQARQLHATAQSLKIQSDLQSSGQPTANPNSTAEGIVARTPEEVFGMKSAALKYEIAPDGMPGNKMVQIDGEAKENGFLFSQDQLPSHLARSENAAHSADAAQRSLMPQTLDQIVQKAVLSLNNGQHEVQIDLKPDFLGHIRMQIVSEGQLVTVKIVAELPFVKDLLENNLHQLKADLQAQGLDIDELEVSVAHDFHGEADTGHAAEDAKVQAIRDEIDRDEGPSEKQDPSQSQSGGTMAETAVDYFA
jgi:flagellar hook-length control protein FliK